MESENKKKTYLPKWFYIVAFALLGIWAISVLFFAIGTLVHFLLIFLLIVVIILIVRGKKNQPKSNNP